MNKTSSLSPYTIVGLFIAFIGATLVILTFDSFAPAPLTNSFILTRELSLFLLAGILILIIIKGEKLDLESIGLHNRHWGKSILWSFLLLLIFMVMILGCLGLFKLVGIEFGQAGSKYDHLSLWVMTVMVLRAGIVEELFYRGYIMERLYKLSNHWLVFLVLPSLVFGLLHFRQGIGGIIIATLSGLLLSYFYWKKRDLKMNMMTHFMGDFIPNVLIPLITGEAIQ